MLSPSQIQFQVLTADAQRAALQRLALRGFDIKTISMQTGMPEADVRRHLAPAPLSLANTFVRAIASMRHDGLRAKGRWLAHPF